MLFTTFLPTLLAAASIAAPVVVAISDVVVTPHITAPEEGALWPVGSTQVVKWDTDKIPENQRNDPGQIWLGYVGDGNGNHLDVDHPLAKDFPISAGQATVIVPDVPTRDDYFVDLFGDSNNLSPQFTITVSQGN